MITRLGKMAAFGVAWIHLWVCAWFYVGNRGWDTNFVFEDETLDTNATWLVAYYNRTKPFLADGLTVAQPFEYLWSAYFVVVTFTTVGYG